MAHDCGFAAAACYRDPDRDRDRMDRCFGIKAVADEGGVGMKQFTYRPKGVCSSRMDFTVDGDKIVKVQITGGCPGNLLGISKILEQKTIAETIAAFEGVRCLSLIHI